MVNWVYSFLTNRRASMRLDATTTTPFPVPDGTPQGSPLSPILSAIFTSYLLSLSATWTHSSLSLYVDDGAILAISATPYSAVENARSKLMAVLNWLHTNGLNINCDKTELMVFSPPRYRGPKPTTTYYSDHSNSIHTLKTTTRLRYLGFYLTPTLDWRPHVSIMAMRARSTIRGLSILGNSVRGLDLIHWKQVYLMYVIPILTYGAPVWLTGHRQKGLIGTLQTAQNEGVHKITGAFRTTPTNAIENMIGIAPIKYLLPRIIHSFHNRMITTNPHHLLHTIQTDDQCTYWRESPPTNLTALLHDLGPSTYAPTQFRPWSPTNAQFSPPHPPPRLSTVLYYIPSTVDSTYVIHIASKTHSTYTLLQSHVGLDHTQALGLAALSALRNFPTITPHYVHSPEFKQKLTSLNSHRDSRLLYDIRNTIDNASPLTYHFYQYYTRAKDSPNQAQRRLWNQRFLASPRSHLPPPPLSPRDFIWKKIQDEYTPITHPSALACQKPDNGKPVAAIRGAIKVHSCLITSSICRIATGHCFDASYSQRFRPQSNDSHACPHAHTCPHLHTCHHVIFQCTRYTRTRRRLLSRPWRLQEILQSEDASERLGLFLKESDCSILRPLPLPLHIHMNTRSCSPPLNPDPP